MGAGGMRAYSLSQSDKVNAGAKTCKLLVSQPVNIGVCYALVIFRLIFSEFLLFFEVEFSIQGLVFLL